MNSAVFSGNAFACSFVCVCFMFISALSLGGRPLVAVDCPVRHRSGSTSGVEREVRASYASIAGWPICVNNHNTGLVACKLAQAPGACICFATNTD